MTAHCSLESCLERFRSPDPSTRREAAEALAEWQAGGPLVEGLKDQNPGVQEAAMAGLSRIGGPQVVSSLMPLLREDAGIRNRAVEVLEHAGGDALYLLLPFVRHADAHLRKIIVDTLGKLRDPRAIETLTGALQDTDANVRSAAADALAELQGVDAVPQLLSLLKDEEWVVFSVVEALGHLGAPSAIPPLLDLLERGSQPIQCAVVEALGHFHHRECVAPLLRLLPQTDGLLRDLIVRSVVSLAISCGEDTMDSVDQEVILGALLAATESEEPDIVRRAIKGFEWFRQPVGATATIRALERVHAETGVCPEDLVEVARETLMQCMNPAALTDALRSRSESVVQLVAETLGELRIRDAEQALTLCMSHPDRAVRRAVIRALGRIGDPTGISAVVLALDDQAEDVRAAAAVVVGAWNNRLRIEPLCRRLMMEPCPDVRAAIVESLCAQDDPLTTERLLTLLRDSHEEVRAAAATGLGRLRAPQSLTALMDSVNDPAARVRAAVIEALGAFHQDDALEAILLTLGDDDEHVRLAAVLAIARWDCPEAHQALIVQGLGDSHLLVRYRAAEVLGKKRVREAVGALLDLAQADREPGMLRQAALRAIGRIGDSAARECLTQVIWDRDAAVSMTAAEVLDSLESGGEGDDPWK